MVLLADTLTPTTFFDYIQWGGIVFILIVALFGFYKEWWVFGKYYRELKESNARWMDLALRSANLAESIDQLRREKPL